MFTFAVRNHFGIIPAQKKLTATAVSFPTVTGDAKVEPGAVATGCRALDTPSRPLRVPQRVVAYFPISTCWKYGTTPLYRWAFTSKFACGPGLLDRALLTHAPPECSRVGPAASVTVARPVTGS